MLRLQKKDIKINIIKIRFNSIQFNLLSFDLNSAFNNALYHQAISQKKNTSYIYIREKKSPDYVAVANESSAVQL